MKKYVIAIILMTSAFMLAGNAEAQKKKTKKTTASTKSAKVKFTPKEFGTLAAVTDLTDENEINPEYQSLKSLIETNGVTIAYADSTFKPKEPLRRGDFVITFNSALEAIKKAAESAGLDSTAINTYDKNQSYVTSVGEITDVNDGSIYFPAAQSLIEHWGIAAPFSKNKLLNAGEVMKEGEVYDILKATLGYSSPGTNPYTTAMTRGKFAMVLNNAVNTKLSQVNELADVRRESLDSSRRDQEALLKQQDRQRRDSLTKEVELSKIDAQKKEAEAWNKLSDREKRKQIKSQSSK